MSIGHFTKILSIMFDRPQIESKSILFFFAQHAHAFTYRLLAIKCQNKKNKHVAPVLKSSTWCAVFCATETADVDYPRALSQVHIGCALKISQRICRMKDTVKLASQLSGAHLHFNRQWKQTLRSTRIHTLTMALQFLFNSFEYMSENYKDANQSISWKFQVGMSDLFAPYSDGWNTRKQNALWPEPFILWFNGNLFISIIKLGQWRFWHDTLKLAITIWICLHFCASIKSCVHVCSFFFNVFLFYRCICTARTTIYSQWRLWPRKE